MEKKPSKESSFDSLSDYLNSLDSLNDFSDSNWGNKIDSFLEELNAFTASALEKFSEQQRSQIDRLKFNQLQSVASLFEQLAKSEFKFASIGDLADKKIIKPLLIFRLKLVLFKEGGNLVGASKETLKDYQAVIDGILKASIDEKLGIEDFPQHINFFKFLIILLNEIKLSLKQADSLSLATDK